MNISLFQILAAVLMVGVVLTLIIATRRYMAYASERRMLSMLECAGINVADISGSDTETIMREIRQRCRTCATEDVCERWLAGEVVGGNSFCPNAKVFETLSKTIDATG
jgi:hypothetical protein